MSTTPKSALVKWWPAISDEPTPSETSLHTRLLFNGLNDANQAIVTLKGQLDGVTQTVTTNIIQSSGSSPAPPAPPSSFPGLGGVNDISGDVTYTTTGTDNGVLLILNDASGTAVTLNSGVTSPFFLFTSNLGTAGVGTFTPNSGTINGVASFALNPLYTAIMVFDGTNWHATALPIVPSSMAKVAHEWLDSYNAATGVFTQSQPAYSDISGTPVLPSTIAAVAHEFLTSYTSGTGAFTQAQPAFTDISGVATVAQIPALPESQITGLTADLAAKAPLASPTFTGVVTQPEASVLTAATTATSATAGAATALPATPAIYLEISVNGVIYKFPGFSV